MTIQNVHNRLDWFIASQKTKDGKYHLGIRDTRLGAIKDCLASIYKLKK